MDQVSKHPESSSGKGIAIAFFILRLIRVFGGKVVLSTM